MSTDDSREDSREHPDETTELNLDPTEVMRSAARYTADAATQEVEIVAPAVPTEAEIAAVADQPLLTWGFDGSSDRQAPVVVGMISKADVPPATVTLTRVATTWQEAASDAWQALYGSELMQPGSTAAFPWPNGAPTPAYDALKGTVADEEKRLRAELRAEGYKGAPRGFDHMHKGDRVRLLTDQTALGLSEGSGTLLGVFRKGDSDWSAKYNRPDVELLVHLDRPMSSLHPIIRCAHYAVVLHEPYAEIGAQDPELVKRAEAQEKGRVADYNARVDALMAEIEADRRMADPANDGALDARMEAETDG